MKSFGMNLHIKTGSAIKNYVLDPNSDVENDFFLNLIKNTKINLSSESAKTNEHKRSNNFEKYYFSRNALYKINL